MSGIGGIGSDTIGGILDSLYAASGSSAPASDSTSDGTSPETKSNTSETTGTTDLTASLAVLAAEARLSMIETLFDDSASPGATMNQFFASAENYKVLTQSDILETHPELVSAALESGASSSASAEIEDYLSGITSSGSIIDYLA